jgi:anti-sigma regulatory factor (Ser/Thr protein kinase)
MTERRTSVLALLPLAESVAVARRWLASLLGIDDIDAPERDDAVLVLSELVTNAIRHAGSDVVCHAAVSPAAIEIAVADSEPRLPVLEPPEPSRVGGIGLMITNALSSQWGVAEFAGGKVVWARFDLSGGGLLPAGGRADPGLRPSAPRTGGRQTRRPTATSPRHRP